MAVAEKQDGPEPAPVARRFRRRRRANATRDAARSVEQKVRLSPGELEQLRARAGEAGVSVPRLLVESALSPVGVTVSDRRTWGIELMGLHRELSGAAINLNQVAKKANTTHEIPSAFGATMADLRRAAEKLERCVDVLIEENRVDQKRANENRADARQVTAE